MVELHMPFLLLILCLSGWDQSEKYVKIYVTSIPGVDKIVPNDVDKEFTTK